ncbi:retrovirus-related pol polyprotein from transposon TNT 1-94 [Tanacetum coccineum]|uniref:Retrovirus-related pol polyprotein from transposon TNT 1-94 n=1 Tax=Tanacetum coccineum TaxID=301880 RepID=A0ABQ5A098_9ASTR
MQQPMSNLEDIIDPTTAMNMALADCSTGYEYRDRQMQMVGGNGGNQFRQYVGQNVGNQNGYNAVHNVENQNPNRNGNVVEARAEDKEIRNNNNQIRCYNCRGYGHLARNCTVRPRRRGAAYLQTQLLIAQKEEARIQLQAKEFDLMAAAGDLDEIEEVNANCILMANLQQALTSGTQTDKAPVYDLDRSAELSKEKSIVSSLQEEKNKLKSDFKIREDELLDKQIQLEKKIKELDNILIKTGQSIQTMHMLSPKPDSFYHTEQKMALGYQNPFYLKQAQQKQQSLYNGKVLLEKHDPPAVYDSEETLELAQENEILPIVNQVDARVQNFEIQFLKEAANFVRDFKSLAKEADESLTKHKALELEIERLLRAVGSHDIMSIVQSNYGVHTSNLQTELERTKERFENCIIKKENEYVKLWNDWYKKCEECKYDKISYDKAYNDMQQKIKRLQAQLGDQKGKSKDTPCVSNTLDHLSQKLENKNVELEFQVLNYAKENAHLKTTYKNLVSQQKDTTKGVDNTAKTRRPQPRSNTKKDRVPSASKSSCSKNKEVEVEEHPRNLLLSKNKKHMSSECNNIKLAIQNDKSEVVCAMCCSKHMTGNLKLLINFVWKFLGTARFGNDHIAAILGFGDLQ